MCCIHFSKKPKNEKKCWTSSHEQFRNFSSLILWLKLNKHNLSLLIFQISIITTDKNWIYLLRIPHFKLDVLDWKDWSVKNINTYRYS